jgi:SAM-dependent methyltransferase
MMPHLVAAYRRLQDLVVPERHMVKRFIATHLPAASPGSGLALDVGAGTAPFAPVLGAAAPGLHYVAVDHIANDTTGVVADAFSLPFPTGSVGLACYFQVLAHLPDPDAALAEAKRLLMPDGCLLISYPLLCPQGRSRDLWRWTLPGMERLLDRSGFDIIAHEPQGGIVSYFLATLALVPGRLLVAHRQGWRSGRNAGDALRLAIAFLLSLPFHLLGFAAWALDRRIDRQPAFYVGGMVLARLRREGQGDA